MSQVIQKSPLPSSLASAPDLSKNKTVDKAMMEKASKVAQDFESIFLGMMLKSMRAAVPEGDLMDSGQGGKVFEEMLDGEYAKIMSKQGMSELAKNLAGEMMKAMARQEKLPSVNSQVSIDHLKGADSLFP